MNLFPSTLHQVSSLQLGRAERVWSSCKHKHKPLVTLPHSLRRKDNGKAIHLLHSFPEDNLIYLFYHLLNWRNEGTQKKIWKSIKLNFERKNEVKKFYCNLYSTSLTDARMKIVHFQPIA